MEGGGGGWVGGGCERISKVSLDAIIPKDTNVKLSEQIRSYSKRPNFGRRIA